MSLVEQNVIYNKNNINAIEANLTTTKKCDLANARVQKYYFL